MGSSVQTATEKNDYKSLFYSPELEMAADLMWGGVPFTIPSVTAMKHISGAVEVKRECNLPIGGHYNARQTMEREMIGHKMSRREMVDSYEYYDRLTRRARSHVRQTPGFTAGEEYRQYRRTKPSLLGWTQPRKESVIGYVDIRKTLPGYIGGVKIRDSMFAN